VLWVERKRLAAIAEREAAGESLWSADIDAQGRTKLVHIWRKCAGGPGAQDAVWSFIEMALIHDAGITITGDEESLLTNADTDLVLSLIEGAAQAMQQYVAQAMQQHRESPPGSQRMLSTVKTSYKPVMFEERVNEIFNAHRVAFRLVDGVIVPFSSDELHVSVVEPTLRLLIGANFDKAHDAYIASLKEISKNEAANAITDAGTALQETLKALGCQGNRLGPLIKDARKRGLIAPHDQTFADGIEKVMDWVSAERSETGDAHKQSDAVLDDAWLMVHVVGALILRLVGKTPRG
jgi:AbiJ N-terminal domain 4